MEICVKIGSAGQWVIVLCVRVLNEAAFCAGGGARKSAPRAAAARPPGGHLGIESLLQSMLLHRKIEEGLDKEEPSLSATTALLIRPNFKTLSRLLEPHKSETPCIFQVTHSKPILRNLAHLTEQIMEIKSQTTNNHQYALITGLNYLYL